MVYYPQGTSYFYTHLLKMIKFYCYPFMDLTLSTMKAGTQVCLFVSIFWQHHAACGILVPQPGIELHPLHWQHRVLTTEPPGKSQGCIFFFYESLFIHN